MKGNGDIQTGSGSRSYDLICHVTHALVYFCGVLACLNQADITERIKKDALDQGNPILRIKYTM